MVQNDKSIKCTKFHKIDQNVDYASMWCGRRVHASFHLYKNGDSSNGCTSGWPTGCILGRTLETMLATESDC